MEPSARALRANTAVKRVQDDRRTRLTLGEGPRAQSANNGRKRIALDGLHQSRLIYSGGGRGRCRGCDALAQSCPVPLIITLSSSALGRRRLQGPSTPAGKGHAMLRVTRQLQLQPRLGDGGGSSCRRCRPKGSPRHTCRRLLRRDEPGGTTPPLCCRGRDQAPRECSARAGGGEASATWPARRCRKKSLKRRAKGAAARAPRSEAEQTRERAQSQRPPGKATRKRQMKILLHPDRDSTRPAPVQFHITARARVRAGSAPIPVFLIPCIFFSIPLTTCSPPPPPPPPPPRRSATATRASPRATPQR